MSTTLSHFANTKNLTLGGTAIGSTENLRITRTLTRAEGQDNAVIGGNVSSHVVGRHYKWSFETMDFSALTQLSATGSVTLSCVSVAAETQGGTPLPDQTVTLTNCVIDDLGIGYKTKSDAGTTISGHCLAAASDVDQFTHVNVGS